MAEPKILISLRNIQKSFGAQTVLSGISLDIYEGEFLTLLGPSGCGKTTILRMIAGFEALNSGDIRIDGESVTRLPPDRRKLHTVFQSYALFPHMNVYENIAYGLRAAGKKKGEIQEAVHWALEMVQLEGFEKRMPVQMSGGQKQRVSIARAIVNRPSVLLLDEPLTALDMKLRKEMRYKLRELQQQLGITFLYVTHDQEEAMVMSDRIAVLNGGHAEQMGTPREIYTAPASAFVSDFIGDTNAFDAVVRSCENGVAELQCESGCFLAAGEGLAPGEFVNVSIRPHETRWSKEPVPGFRLQGAVKDFVFTGSFRSGVLELANGRELRLTRLAGEGLPELGEQVYLSWDPTQAVVMKDSSSRVHQLIENIDLGAWIQA